MNVRHLVAILSKFLLTICIAYVTLTVFFGVPIGNIFWMSILITAAGYIIGDLYVLKKLGNFIASIFDFGLVFLVFWLFADPYIDNAANQLFGAAIAALFIAIAEFVYHIFIEVTNPLRPSKADVDVQKYATEVGEEFSPSGDDLLNENDDEKKN